ncbi:apolipoprotein L4 [Rhinichthys klamathensis goyatoka]|uniref:apolipoprotein L4 n=1 Tax=Rhinichthys klamathensis goyatoka TaxID=3034132 RepID=UPI0024B5B3B0|nr:apolipoprotein L4 [Rhinichthys klamathensis goyatoka]
MGTREQLQELLSEYVVDTLNYIQTVRDFCDKQQKWTLQRETELEKMRDIKDQADKVSLKFDHVQRSENKAKAFGEYLWSGLTQVTADSRLQELEKELGAVLKDTLEGLEKLDHFLDAVEKLTVTSLFVFTGRSFLPKGESPESVRSVITAARMASPLLIHFKRNAETFFLPSLSNVDVLAFQLDKYIRITEKICERMEKKSKSFLWTEDTYRYEKAQPVKFSLNLSEDSMQKMLDHLKQLCKIRMDQNTKLTFIFQDHALHFIGLFSKCRSRMEKFLSDLEENAVQLDKMKMGASISTVAGSSVGIAGGILSIVGLALVPVTAGVSLALTLTGVGLGVTSGVNSLVTGITEAAVNCHHGKNAQNIFQRYMDDVGKILDCLEQACSEEHIEEPNVVDMFKAGKLIACAGGVGKGIDVLVDAASAVKVLKTDEVIATATKVGLQEAQSARSIPQLAADLPDIGQLAKGTPLALSKSARAGFITLNALFIGLDVIFICKDSISLAKGSKSEASLLIRSRAALWKSELEAWQQIHDSLCIGIWRFRKSQEVLEQRFLP